jgi:preprotein translocase subunit SecB
MKPIPVSLERYFFTTQSVIANPDHDINSGFTKFHLKIENNLSLLPEQNNRYGIEVTVSLDKENSNNAPYDVNVTAFGVIQVIDDKTDQNEIDYLLKVLGPQMMIGVIRERIAEMTSRGPWPTAHLNFIPIQINIENP